MRKSKAWPLLCRMFLIAIVYGIAIELLNASGFLHKVSIADTLRCLVPFMVLPIAAYRWLKKQGIISGIRDFVRQTLQFDHLVSGFAAAIVYFVTFLLLGRLFGSGSLLSGAYIPPTDFVRCSLMGFPFILIGFLPLYWVLRVYRFDGAEKESGSFALSVFCSVYLTLLTVLTVASGFIIDAEWSISIFVPVFTACVIVQLSGSFLLAALFLALQLGSYACLGNVPYGVATCIVELLFAFLLSVLLRKKNRKNYVLTICIVAILCIAVYSIEHTNREDVIKYYERNAKRLEEKNEQIKEDSVLINYSGMRLLLFDRSLFSPCVDYINLRGKNGLTVFFEGDKSPTLLYSFDEMLEVNEKSTDTSQMAIGDQWIEEFEEHYGLHKGQTQSTSFTKIGKGWFLLEKRWIKEKETEQNEGS